MKQFFLTMITIALFSINCFAQNKSKHVSEMPAPVMTFIQKHFPEEGILKSVEDHDGSNISYEILLDNEVKLEFNNKGEIVEIDGKTQLPDEVLPTKILDYVKENYPKNFITEWKLDDSNKQEIKLDSGVDLEFTLDGRLKSNED